MDVTLMPVLVSIPFTFKHFFIEFFYTSTILLAFIYLMWTKWNLIFFCIISYLNIEEIPILSVINLCNKVIKIDNTILIFTKAYNIAKENTLDIKNAKVK